MIIISRIMGDIRETLGWRGRAGRTVLVLLLLLGLALPGLGRAGEKRLVVGSGPTLEERLLGQLALALLSAGGFEGVDRTGLADRALARQAVKDGLIDLYFDYTAPGLDQNGLVCLPAMNYARTLGLLVLNPTAERLQLVSISDLTARMSVDPSRIILGVGARFWARPDGWPALKAAYGLKAAEEAVQIMDPVLLYPALAGGWIDAAVGQTADARLANLAAIVLTDDRNHFQPAHPAPIVRAKTAGQHPELESIFRSLSARLDREAMIELKEAVELEGRPPAQAAAEWLKKERLD
ncbi:MAG: hypothetical protein JRC92_03790 [Deltaproteobacteria bacterium]|nr:hypothetical protein [Deltaproteobacteria bacterium]